MWLFSCFGARGLQEETETSVVQSDPSRRSSCSKRYGRRLSQFLRLVFSHGKKTTRAQSTTNLLSQAEEGRNTLEDGRDERAYRVFRNRVDKVAQVEIVDLVGQLNRRIEILALKRRSLVKAGTPENNEQTENIAPLSERNKVIISTFVKEALGQQLQDVITNTPDSQRQNNKVFTSIMLDAWQAWITYCVYLATSSLLFGSKLRSRPANEINEAIRCMSNEEPDLGIYWKKIWERSKLQLGHAALQERNDKLGWLSPFTPPSKEDTEMYFSLERVHELLIKRGRNDEEDEAVPRHWQALLYLYDRQRPAFNEVVEQTKWIIFEGLRLISEDAREPFTFTQANRGTIDNASSDIVQLAVNLADMMRNMFFSATLATTWIEPQSAFDENNMEQEEGSGEVQCTIALGLCEEDPLGYKKVIVKPKVILSGR